MKKEIILAAITFCVLNVHSGFSQNENLSSKPISSISGEANNSELLLGEWEFAKIELVDRSIVDSMSLIQLEKINNKTSRVDLHRLNFKPNDKLTTFKFTENDQNKFDYKLINERDFIYYPNFENKKKVNGNLIALILINENGSLYSGTNVEGPFEIIELTKNKLVLKNLHMRLLRANNTYNLSDEAIKAIESIENALFIYERVIANNK